MFPDGSERKRLQIVDDLLAGEWTCRPELDDLARIAAYICGASVESSVSLVDEQHQRQVAVSQGELGAAPREHALCEPTIRTGTLTLTENAAVDPRFRDNPFVDGRASSLRFYLSLPLVVDDQTVGSLCAYGIHEVQLDELQLSRLGDVADAVSTCLALRHHMTRLHHEAVIDPLTGTYNRHALDDALDRFISRGDRGFTQPGVLFIDLNDFKAVNDRHGHDGGDDVLREAGRRLRSIVRTSDFVVRMGGDEFVVLVDESPELEAAEAGMRGLADRVRDGLGAPYVLSDGRTVRVSAAVGWALPEPGGTPSVDLLTRADAAMYSDKRTAVPDLTGADRR